MGVGVWGVGVVWVGSVGVVRGLGLVVWLCVPCCLFLLVVFCGGAGSCMPVLRRAAVSYVVCARYRVCVWYGYPCVCVLGLVVGVLVYMLCTVFSMSAF